MKAHSGPWTIRYGFGTTPVGPALAALSGQGICSLRLIDGNHRRAVEELQERYPRAILTPDDAAAARVFRAVAAYLDGKLENLQLDLEGTPFQKKVWEALRRIPHGQTRSYQDIARQVGKPRAARAVGAACGANRIGILVPCHRVLASDGSLGGYGWGLQVKQALLDLEQSGRA